MRSPPKKTYRYLIVFTVLVGFGFIIASTGHAQKMEAEGWTLSPADPSQPNWALAEELSAKIEEQTLGDTQAGLPTPPVLDQCLHCHVLGEEKGLWTPLARWTIFIGIGAVFAFGVFQNAWVWKNRKPWVPVLCKRSD